MRARMSKLRVEELEERRVLKAWTDAPPLGPPPAPGPGVIWVDTVPELQGAISNLKSGQTVTGVRLNRDDLSIQLRDTRDNLRSFLMENVREIRFDKASLMPSYSAMDRKDLDDLVAYLNSLKGEQ